jgi:hypothetical protein
MRVRGARIESVARGSARVVAAALCGALLGALALAAWHWSARGAPSEEAALARAAAVAELVARGEGAWDNVPDPDVGRLLQPNLRARKAGGIAIDSNRYGMRERDFEVPKPAGLVRIALLGDSYVYGNAVDADARLGAVLERELAARSGARIECLHVGMLGWNLEAECAFLRRSLDALEPDLVIHVSVENDLEDSADARGFGALASLSSQVRARADGLVGTRAAQCLHPEARGLLTDALDWESRTRYARANAALRELVAALERRGTRYVALFHWPNRLPLVREHLAVGLASAQLAWLPAALDGDERYRVSNADRHWNAAGHAHVARALYELVRTRELLAGIALPAWDDARAAYEALCAAGEREALGAPRPALAIRASRIRRALDTSAWDTDSAGQVHAGLDERGRVSPYASLLLACAPGRRVVLRGERLGAAGLTGEARVSIDEVEVGRFALAGSAPLDEAFALSPELATRRCVSLRIECDDWTYAEDLRHTVCFRLRTVAIER